MIEAHELTKRYGDTTVMHALSFTIAPSTVTGFLGPNGAGKSTTMRPEAAKHSRAFSVGDEPVTDIVCKALGEAASSDSAPYFYECLLAFASSQFPTGTHTTGGGKRAEATRAGRESSFCGRP